MRLQQPRQSLGTPAGRAVREFGALFLLLLASELLGALVTSGVRTVRDLPPAVLDPRLVGAVVYATLGAAALSVVYVANGRRVPVELHERVQLAGVTGMLLLFCAYAVQLVADLPPFPVDVVTALSTGAVSMGLPALAYAGARGIELRVGTPDRDALPISAGATGAAALAGIAPIFARALGGGWLVRPPIGVLGDPRLSALDLLLEVIVPGILLGIGLAILYNGAVQEGLRETATPAGAVGVVTVLLGATAWLESEVGVLVDSVGQAAAAAAVVLGALSASFLAAGTVRLLREGVDAEPTPVAGASIGVLVVGLSLIGAAAIRPYSVGFVVPGIGFAIVAAVAGVGYERSRSVWVPALSYASYQIAADPALVPHLAELVR